jgi:hypothetical protein
MIGSANGVNRLQEDRDQAAAEGLDKADVPAEYFGLRLTPDPDAVSPTPTPENLARPILAKRNVK